MHSTSKLTCWDKTSATLRATVISRLRSENRSANHLGQLLPQRSHIPVRPRRHGTTCRPEPPTDHATTARLVGLGRCPVSSPWTLRSAMGQKKMWRSADLSGFDMAKRTKACRSANPSAHSCTCATHRSSPISAGSAQFTAPATARRQDHNRHGCSTCRPGCLSETYGRTERRKDECQIRAFATSLLF